MQKKIVILGGGPSGLGVAWRLVERGFTNIFVIEKKSKLGGLSGSFQIGDLICDYGPHRFSPEYPDLVQKMQTLLGDDFLEVKNEHAVVFKDRVYHYPPRVHEFLNPQSIALSSKVLGSYLFEKLKGLFGKSKLDKEKFSGTIGQTFGPCLYEEVVKPLCEKVWGNPEEMDASFARLRFSIPTFKQWGERLLRFKRASNDKVFWYPKKGFQQLWTELGHFLSKKGVIFLVETELHELEWDKEHIRSVTVKNEKETWKIDLDWLVSTIPIEQLIKKGKFPSSIENTLPSRGMLLGIFEVKHSGLLPARVVIFPEKKHLFNRLTDLSQFSSVINRNPVIQADILTEMDSALWKKTDAEILNAITESVSPFISKQEILSSHLVRVPMAYPIPTRSREEAQSQFVEEFKHFNNLLITGRFASSDYNNCHTAIKKGWSAADCIADDLHPAQWYPKADILRHIPIRD